MHKGRVAVLLLIVVGMVVAAFCLWRFGMNWLPGCLFRRFTGLECPGCGMTRGTYALFHGRFLEAFLFNPVGMILLPIGLVACGFHAIGWASKKPLPIQIPASRWVSIPLSVIVIGWWILRNLI